VSRNLTNLTPAQIEQFESTFRYFDKDETNTLNVSEMAAALASLGIVYGVSLSLSPRSCFDNPRRRMRTLISSTINYFKNMAQSPSKLSSTSWYVPLRRIVNVGVRFNTPCRSTLRKTKRHLINYARLSKGPQTIRYVLETFPSCPWPSY
jgi:hypothetical protein